MKFISFVIARVVIQKDLNYLIIQTGNSKYASLNSSDKMI